MGTYITVGASRQDIIEEIKREYGQYAEEWALHRCALWGRFRAFVTKDGQAIPAMIVCFELTRTRNGWGYKPMDECMGPYTPGVPLRWLDATPDPRLGYSTQWRERVALLAGLSKPHPQGKKSGEKRAGT